MNEKKITLVLTGDGPHKEISLEITPKTNTRMLRGQLRIPEMSISVAKDEPPIPQGNDLFPLVEEGGRLYATVVERRPFSQSDLAAIRSVIGSASDPASDVAEKHDDYLAGILR